MSADLRASCSQLSQDCRRSYARHICGFTCSSAEACAASRYIVAQQQQKQGPNAVSAMLPEGTAARTYHEPAHGILGCPHYRRR